jgi:mono/diheme cytochrome c family protein
MPLRWITILLLLLGGLTLQAAEGREIYASTCVACHGPDGAGKTPQGRKVKAKDLRESKLTAAETATRIREGARNKSGVMVMPPLGQELTADEIAAVIPVVIAFRPSS